jgi:cell division protein FtsL
MITLFKKLSLGRKILAIMLVIMVLTMIFGLLLSWYSSKDFNAGYDYPFQGVIIFYAYYSLWQFLILFFLGIIVNLPSDMDYSNFNWTITDSDRSHGLTPLGFLILIQFLFFLVWFGYSVDFFMPEENIKDSKYWFGGWENIANNSNVPYIILYIMSAVSIIFFLVPHLFNRFYLTMRKIESTEKKIDELSNQIKDLSEQLKNR